MAARQQRQWKNNQLKPVQQDNVLTWQLVRYGLRRLPTVEVIERVLFLDTNVNQNLTRLRQDVV